MSRTSIISYTVTGRGPFPVDMLRYAEAWPQTQDDASKIERSKDQWIKEGKYSVRLNSISRSFPNGKARWESFGFNVSEEVL